MLSRGVVRNLETAAKNSLRSGMVRNGERGPKNNLRLFLPRFFISRGPLRIPFKTTIKIVSRGFYYFKGIAKGV